MKRREITRIKTRLMCYGAKPAEGIDRGRQGGAGPTGGRYMLLPRTVTSSTNVPFQGKFISLSPYRIETLRADYALGEYLLYEDHRKLFEVRMVENRFLGLKTSDGVPVWKLAAPHGTETIGVTVCKYCSYWENGNRCMFCAIQQDIKSHDGKSLAVKNPEHIAEIVLTASKLGFKHITLTSGCTGNADGGISLFIQYVKKVKEATPNFPVHVQIEPPKSLADLGRLYSAGTDTVGIHIETVDEDVRRRICPGKAQIKQSIYFQAWREAVKIFGENQVSTAIIVGLGEDENKTLNGLEKICSAGILPCIIPLRPLLQTDMEDLSPPKPEAMFKILMSTASYTKQYGLKFEANRAGCIRCGACSPIREAVQYGV